MSSLVPGQAAFSDREDTVDGMHPTALSAKTTNMWLPAIAKDQNRRLGGLMSLWDPQTLKA